MASASKQGRPNGRLAKRKLAWRRHAVRLGVRVGVVVLMLTAVGLVLHVLERLFYSGNPHFTLENVHVPRGDLASTEVVDRLKLELGADNLYALDLGQMRERLLQDPVLQEVEVRRVLPDSLHVSVYSRTPVAQLLRRGGPTLDSEGYVMKPSDGLGARELPILAGIHGASRIRHGQRLTQAPVAAALEFLRLKAERPDGHRLQVHRLIWCASSGHLRAVLRGNAEYGICRGAEVVLSPDDLASSVDRALRVVEIRSLANQRTGYIDTTYRRVPVLPYHP
mgnify:CR=1 FL=1